MKKITYTLIFLAAITTASGQGFLKKIKAKVEKAIVQPATNVVAVPGAGSEVLSNTTFTNPGQYGTLIKTFSQTEINAHMGGSDGGFSLSFKDLKVVNNQLQFQVADYETTLYDYTGGQLVDLHIKPNTSISNATDGDEGEQYSKDFSVMDATNAILKKGPHVSSGMTPGKPTQTLIFNGKAIGDFYIYAIAHNADSSVVAVAGATLDAGGLKFKLTTSAGQTVAIPKNYGYLPLVSPDGKMAAALDQGQGSGGTAYLSDGTVVKTGTATNNKVWLRNSGSVFNVEQSNHKALFRNGVLYHTFDSEVEPKIIFIGKDDKNMSWYGDHGLYFSDGTAFENGASAHKVIIDGKEVIVFLVINVTNGNLYLCRHDL